MDKNFIGILKAGKFPPQMDLVRKYGTNRNFNFQIVNTKDSPVRVRMFGTLTDYVSAFSSGAISVTTETVKVLNDGAAKKEAINYYFQYPDPYEQGNTFLEDLATYLRTGGDKVLNLPAADFTTDPTGGLEAEVTDTEHFYTAATLMQWLEAGGFKKIPVTLGMLFSRGLLGGLAQMSAMDYIDGDVAEKEVVTAVSSNGGGPQEGALPFVVDGNFADGLTATSSGQPIRELWSWILDNGEMVLKALQVTGAVENMVQQNITLKEKSPFRTPGDVVYALSKYQNPYVVNAHMGLADNLNMVIGKNNCLEFDVFPGANTFSMFF